MAEVISLVEKCDVKLNLVQIMEYHITEECLSLFNTNGTEVISLVEKCDVKLNLVQIMEYRITEESMTGKPYSCLPLDLWTEMTMNKGSKMKAG